MPRMLTFAVVLGASATCALAQGGPGEPPLIENPIEPPGDIPGCEVSLSFNFPGLDDILAPPFGTELEFVPVDAGQTVIPFGMDDWPFKGVVNNAAAIAPANYNGPVGGPDPTGERGGMMHVQRASVGSPALAGPVSLYDGFHAYVGPTPERAVFITLDVYKNAHTDSQLFDFVDFASGGNTARVVAGGQAFSGSEEILANLRGEPNVIEGLLFPGDGEEFAIYAPFLSPKDVPENGWYTLGVLLLPDSTSYWLRDTETTGAVDVRTPVRTVGPYAGRRMFEEYGLGLEEDWAQVFPGTLDDPATPDIVEGFGLAFSPDSGNRGALNRDGNQVHPRLFLLTGEGVNFLRVGGGIDLDPVTDESVPGYEIRDWWVDNYCVRLSDEVAPCYGDLDGDGDVGAADLAILIGSWGMSGAVVDLDGNGAVAAGDLAALIGAWGICNERWLQDKAFEDEQAPE